MPLKFCKTCGRPKHKGLCDLVELSDGRTVHAAKVDDPNFDVAKQVAAGEVSIVKRWKPKDGSYLQREDRIK